LTTKTFQFIGDNGLSRMRKGCVPLRGIYDLVAPVDPAKLQKLKDYLLSSNKYVPLYLIKLLSTACLHYLSIL